jgi:hypothetical protein
MMKRNSLKTVDSLDRSSSAYVAETFTTPVKSEDVVEKKSPNGVDELFKLRERSSSFADISGTVKNDEKPLLKRSSSEPYSSEPYSLEDLKLLFPPSEAQDNTLLANELGALSEKMPAKQDESPNGVDDLFGSISGSAFVQRAKINKETLEFIESNAESVAEYSLRMLGGSESKSPHNAFEGKDDAYANTYVYPQGESVNLARRLFSYLDNDTEFFKRLDERIDNRLVLGGGEPTVVFLTYKIDGELRCLVSLSAHDSSIREFDEFYGSLSDEDKAEYMKRFKSEVGLLEERFYAEEQNKVKFFNFMGDCISDFNEIQKTYNEEDYDPVVYEFVDHESKNYNMLLKLVNEAMGKVVNEGVVYHRACAEKKAMNHMYKLIYDKPGAAIDGFVAVGLPKEGKRSSNSYSKKNEKKSINAKLRKFKITNTLYFRQGDTRKSLKRCAIIKGDVNRERDGVVDNVTYVGLPTKQACMHCRAMPYRFVNNAYSLNSQRFFGESSPLVPTSPRKLGSKSVEIEGVSHNTMEGNSTLTL